MGLFDKAKEFLGQHGDKVDQGVDKAGDMVDERTQGKHAEHVDRAQDLVKERIGPNETPPPAAPAPPA